MAETEEKALPPPEVYPLIEAPAEEKLRAEVEDLRRQLDEERKKNEKKHEKKAPQHPKSRTLWLIGIALLIVIVLAFFLGWLPRHRRQQQLQKAAQAEANALPTVSVTPAEASPANSELELPGTIQAITEAPLLARAEGFLVQRYADFGDHVKKGQLLARIEAPDLDAQVRQGQAQLEQSQAALKQATRSLEQGEANEELARVTAVRWQNLWQRGAVSRQENDQNQQNYKAQVANVGALNQAVAGAQQNVVAAQANLRRLQELQGYEYVRAPFDGVVTYRNVDVGALISNGSTLLFRVAQIDRLRTYIYVPQANAPTMQVGQAASLLALEYPNRRFFGRVTRISESFDLTTRTMLAEVQLPNIGDLLLPGMYVEVDLNSARKNPPLLVPDEALVIRSSGTQLAVLENPQKNQNQGKNQPEYTGSIHLQAVGVGRDYGATVEINSGLKAGDLVVINPGDDVREGAKVNANRGPQNQEGTPQAPGAGKADTNTEQRAPKTGAEPPPNKPTREQKTRGPGY